MATKRKAVDEAFDPERSQLGQRAKHELLPKARQDETAAVADFLADRWRADKAAEPAAVAEFLEKKRRADDEAELAAHVTMVSECVMALKSSKMKVSFKNATAAWDDIEGIIRAICLRQNSLLGLLLHFHIQGHTHVLLSLDGDCPAYSGSCYIWNGKVKVFAVLVRNGRQQHWLNYPGAQCKVNESSFSISGGVVPIDLLDFSKLSLSDIPVSTLDWDHRAHPHVVMSGYDESIDLIEACNKDQMSPTYSPRSPPYDP